MCRRLLPVRVPGQLHRLVGFDRGQRVLPAAFQAESGVLETEQGGQRFTGAEMPADYIVQETRNCAQLGKLPLSLFVCNSAPHHCVLC